MTQRMPCNDVSSSPTPHRSVGERIDLHVLVEARFLSAAPHSSIARYIRELVAHWADLPDGPVLTLYGPGARPSGLQASPRARWRSPPPMAARFGRRVEGGRLWLNSFFAISALLERPDVIFFPWPFVPRVLRRPSVVTMHDLCYLSHPLHYADRGRSQDDRARAAVRAADRIIAVSQACKDSVVDAYRVDPQRITVIHHGVANQFGPTPAPRDTRVCELLGVSPPYLLCVSTHERRKNLETLVRAFVKLVSVGGIDQPPSLVLVGRQSKYTERLRAISASSSRAEKALIFLESVSDDDLAVLYRRASAVVMPSLCEGFGFPLLEALQSGTPVVASDLPVFRELAGDGCVYVPPTDVSNWTRALAEVLERQQESREVHLAAAQHIRQLYTWRDAAIRTLEVLSQTA